MARRLCAVTLLCCRASANNPLEAIASVDNFLFVRAGSPELSFDTEPKIWERGVLQQNCALHKKEAIC